LANLLDFIYERLDEGYDLFSLDECGFGSQSLVKKSYSIRGKPATGKFKRVLNATLLACVSIKGYIAYQFILGGCTSLIFEQFLL